jgi:hypothetical protein
MSWVCPRTSLLFSQSIQSQKCASIPDNDSLLTIHGPLLLLCSSGKMKSTLHGPGIDLTTPKELKNLCNFHLRRYSPLPEERLYSFRNFGP